MPGAFKLDHLQLFKLTLFSMAPNFSFPNWQSNSPITNIEEKDIFRVLKTFDREQDGVKSPNRLERGIMEPGYSNLPFVALKSQFNLVLNYIKT